MISKQDRPAPRTAADLERRYSFGKNFAEVMRIAEDTQSAAEDAAKDAQKAADGLSQTAIFNHLTNNGKAKGMLMDENGDIYVNASYLATGVVMSENGHLTIDLSESAMDVFCDEYPSVRKWIQLKQATYGSYQGIYGFGEVWEYDHSEGIKRDQTLLIYPGPPMSDVAFWSQRTAILGTNAELRIYAQANTIPEIDPAVIVGDDGDAKVVINDKVVSWLDNGDGTYTMIGTDE